MNNFLWLLVAAGCISPCHSQEPSKQEPSANIATTVHVVIAPTTVQRRKTGFVSGLQVSDFEIFDNNKPQTITGNLWESPSSLVVAVQRSANMSGLLAKIRKLGPVLTDMVVGQDGEIAVVGFDDKAQVIQDFTNDADEVEQAMMSVNAGSSYAHASIDALMESVQLLKNRPRNRRRIVLMLAERWDQGSKASLRDAVTAAEFADVTVYSLIVSTVVAGVTSEPEPQRPPPLPTTAYRVPVAAPLTPTTIVDNYYLGNWTPLLVNMYHSVKDKFTDNTMEALTRLTGGEGYPFGTDRTLDKAIGNLSEALHSQYLLSYTPNNLHEAGFHAIKVIVKRPHMEVRTRAGYWVAGKPE